jgi:hypothetical protein
MNKTAAKLATLVSTIQSTGNDGDVCEPYSANITDKCAYVHYFEDACEGGGYLYWTAYVLCQESLAIRIVIIIAAVFFMLYVMVFLGAATDDCLCTSISAIVDQLKISQNVAVGLYTVVWINCVVQFRV